MWERKDGGKFSRTIASWAGGDGDQVDRSGDAEGFEEKNGAGDLVDVQKLWKALLAYATKNFPMCCSIGANQDDMQGLIAGHAYSLMAVRDVRTAGGGKDLKMCKVRNPHGETEWTGRWSDKSDMWGKHPNVKNKLKFEAREDGSFWMSFHDFCKYFDTISVNKRSMPLEGCHPDMLRKD